jgi:Holliday junction resolvase-like predicted endonuclease
MIISKSTRHSKITGNFAENLVLYWLSKYGFECANIDHTGIDIIAKNPVTNELMGISVKSRSRNEGKEGTYVSIPKENFGKIEKACETFNCIPYFAIVVDERDKIVVFVLSMKELLRIHPAKNRVSAWTMGKNRIREYYNNPKIIIFELKHRILRWWK